MTDSSDSSDPVHEPRMWRDGRWTARVIKNEDDEGWAVAMTLAGQAEPALVGPWTMGRDKKNPKPLDSGAFNTLVKTAAEVIRRHEQQLHAQLHKRVRLDHAVHGRIEVALDIVADDDDPHAVLSAHSAGGAVLASVTVAADYKLGDGSAAAWVDGGFKRPAGR